MASLGSLVVTLAADTARFQGDLGRAAAIAEARMRNIKDTASRALGALTVAATAAGAGLVVALKQAADRADDMGKLAQASGVAVDQLTRLDYAAKLSGIETETLGKALAKLAGDGAPDAAEALLQLADEFAATPDSAAKTSRAIDTFGEKLGPKLIPLLNQGRAGLKALGDESDRLGLTITSKTAAAAEQFNDNLTRLQSSVTGLATSLLADVGPSIAAYSDLLVKAATGTSSLSSSTSTLASIIRAIIAVIDVAATTFVSFGQSLGAAAAATAAAARGDFAGAMQIIRDRNAEAAEQTRLLDERLAALYGRIAEGPPKPKADGVTEIVVTGKTWSAADEARANAEAVRLETEAVRQRAAAYEETFRVRREWYALADEVQAASNRTFSDFVNSTAGDIGAEAARQLEIATKAVEGSYDEMSVYAKRAAENMQDAFADFLFDPFDGGIKGMLRGFIDVIRRMVAEAAAAKIFDAFKGAGGGKGVGGFFGSVLGGLFGGGKAGGGPVSAGTSYLVGERGPEVVTMGGHGYVTPNNKLGGGQTINYSPVYNITSGVTRQELLPALEATRRQSIADMTRLINGGAFAG